MASRSWSFDGILQQPPIAGGGSLLALNVLRPWVTRDDGGASLAVNAPRYRSRQRLLCGAPRGWAQYESEGTNYYAYGGGLALDSTTPQCVVLIAGTSTLRVYAGSLNSGSLLHEKVIWDATAGRDDLLVGETNPTPPAEALNKCHNPRAFIVAHGAIIALCETTPKVVEPLTPYRLSVCVWQPLAGQSINRGWRFVTQIEDPLGSQLFRRRGSFFQSPGIRVLSASGGVATDLWIPFSDYTDNGGGSGLGPSEAGRHYLLRIMRTGVNQAWTVSASEIAEISLVSGSVPPSGQQARLHAHPPCLERLGTSGLRLICPAGDEWWNNRVIAKHLTTLSGDNWKSPSNWATLDAGQGGKSVGSPPNQTLGSVGNQFVGSAPPGSVALPLIAPLGHAVGVDEGGIALHKLGFAESATTTLDITRLYGVPPAGALRLLDLPVSNPPIRRNIPLNFNVFQILCRDPILGRDYIAPVFPGNVDLTGWTASTSWRPNRAVPRMLFSPDGLTWGQCWAHGHPEETPAMIFRNAAGQDAVVMGSNFNVGLGLRSIRLPAWVKKKPLAVGPGGTQLLLTTVPDPAGVGTGNSVTRVTTMPTGVPPPPCMGSVFSCLVPEGSSERRIGTWRLTDAVVPGGSTTKLKVRAWLYPLLADPSSGYPVPATLSLSVAVGNMNAAPTTPEPIGPSREQHSIPPIDVLGDSNGGWLPITIDSIAGNWVSDVGFAASVPSSSFPTGLRIRSIRLDTEPGESGPPPQVKNPCRFLIAFDSVLATTSGNVDYTGAALPVPAVANSSQPEVATISSFACGSTWTIGLAGEVPEESWDSTAESLPAELPLCTLWESASAFIEVLAMPTSGVVRFRWHTGQFVDLMPTAPSPAVQFSFLRGSPMLFAVSRSSASPANYRLALSVGGMHVATYASSTDLEAPAVSPTQVRYSNATQSQVAAMYWYGGSVDESVASTYASLTTMLEELTMVYDLPSIPEGPEA
jgi:hypothetical protein